MRYVEVRIKLPDWLLKWIEDTANKIASSPRGRRTWERNIMRVLKYRCLRKYLGLE